MKSKRWKRRNRHTRPEWVNAYSAKAWFYGTWRYLVIYKDKVCVLDRFGNKSLAVDLCLDISF